MMTALNMNMIYEIQTMMEGHQGAWESHGHTDIIANMQDEEHRQVLSPVCMIEHTEHKQSNCRDVCPCKTQSSYCAYGSSRNADGHGGGT